MDIKFALYGDSLALPRQNQVRNNQRYISIIRRWLNDTQEFKEIEVIDRAQGGITITELIDRAHHDGAYFDFPADFAIVQCGIVDCAPRPIDEKRRALISKLPGVIKHKIIKYLHNNRSKILSKGKHFVKTEPRKFETIYAELIELLTKSYRRLYVINICPTNKEIESHSPGFTKNINTYNQIIRKVVNEIQNKSIIIIDINSYINARIKDIDEYVIKEDGHHITPLAHFVIAQQIIDSERTFLKMNQKSNG